MRQLVECSENDLLNIRNVSAANIINQHMAAFMTLADEPEAEEEVSIFAPEVTSDNAELDKQIEDLDLSVRSYNCLKRASIHSVRQLVEFSENDLLNIRNFGVKSIEEVKDKLESTNIINQHMAAFMTLADEPEAEEEVSIFAPEVTSDNAELDKQIEDLDLSVRSYNCLKRASIHSVRQLVEFSENDLLNIRNFGVKSIEEVKDKLESMGLSLKA